MATATPAKTTPDVDRRKVARYMLLERHPLYRYRFEEEDHRGRYRLHVLLMGTYEGLWDMLGEILANGQLLDTRLRVTVMTEDPRECARRLQSDAPALGQFISLEGKTAGTCGALYFKKLGEAPAPGEQYHYAFVDFGDTDQNEAQAQAFACTPGMMLAYRTGEDIRVLSPEEKLLAYRADEDYFEKIHPIAHNIEFAYTKGLNPRTTRAEIHRGYYKDPYNHLSDVEAALHIRSKLYSCGIAEPDDRKAAAEFADLMQADPSIVERLAALEHCRWCISKAMQGFRLPDSLEGVYRRGNTTHSKSERWHSILMPYGTGRKLKDEDWEADLDQLRDLDDLDMQSLRLHQRCGAVAQENRPECERMMRHVQNLCLEYADKLVGTGADPKLLEQMFEQLWQGKRSVLPIYDRCVETLRRIQDRIPGLKDGLDEMERYLAPQREYVIRKDYKAQNTNQVVQIPFALTHREEIVLLKLMADKETDCLFSAWQLEPVRVVYADLVQTEEELEAMGVRAGRLDAFLRHNRNGIDTEYHIICPAGLRQNGSAARPLERVKHVFHPLEVWSVRNIKQTLKSIADGCSPDYIDLTGGNPMLTCLAQEYAQWEDLGAFYVRSGQMRNFCNARELEYPAPRMDITVQEMFDQSGAVLRKSDGSKMSDLTELYEKFWNAVKDFRDDWKLFCDDVSNVYKNTKEIVWQLPDSKKKDPEAGADVVLTEDVLRTLLPVFRQLREKGYLRSYRVEKEEALYRVIFSVGGREQAGKVRDTLMALGQCFGDHRVYDLDWKKDGPAIVERSLEVRHMSWDGKPRYRKIARKLADAGVILGLTEDTAAKTMSFTFHSQDIKAAMVNSGKVLEYYIYYTAMLEGGFDDVDMSWLFYHNDEDDSASNEVDVICTRGTTSLFISAKNVKKDSFRKNNFLNYVCYEVSLLADRFGINAKRVLAAPAVKYSEAQGKRHVEQAQSRGVYLLYDECFESSSRLGQILRNIADGRENWAACDD